MEENIAPSIFDEIANERPYFEYATPGQRFVNYIIDIAVLYAFNFVVFVIIGLVMGLTGSSGDDVRATLSNKLFLYGLNYLDYFLICCLMEGLSKGRSLGKIITRTVAVKEDISKMGWNEAIIRSACRLVPFEPLSGLGGTPWHDKWSNTTVIKKRRMM